MQIGDLVLIKNEWVELNPWMSAIDDPTLFPIGIGLLVRKKGRLWCVLHQGETSWLHSDNLQVLKGVTRTEVSI